MKTKYWVLLFAAMLALCAGLSLLLLRGSGSARAEIWSDGKLLCTVDLHRDQTFTVETDLGTNTVEVRGGTIRVTEADCPDQICVRRGACSGGAPVVCLPHRLVIRFTGGGTVDAAAG